MFSCGSLLTHTLLLSSLRPSLLIPFFAGCPQADLREDLPSTKFDKCGGYVEKTDKVYRVYQFSSCIANITCNQPSQIIGAVTSRFTKLFYCGDVTIY